MQPSTEKAEPTTKPLPDRKLTYEEFLEWCDEDTPAEWVDGEIIMASPASLQHQDIGGFLGAILRIFVELHGLGKILIPPFQMKLEHGREPDLLFVANENLSRLHETYLEGPADLAVEIVSTESGARDRGEKFYEYEAGGVREFWLIDPIRQQTEFYLLGEDKLFHHLSPDADGIYRSTVIPGFWFRVAWLWEQPLRPVAEVLKELKLVA
jgi:Uma2 family endonuclease